MAEDTVTYEYSCGNQSGFEYYVLGDDIRKEFDFLKSSAVGNNTIAGNLNEMMNYVKSASSNSSAFLISGNSGTESDLNKFQSEMEQYVNDLKSCLDTLHSAVMTDIDNVNAELDANFGYWKGRKLFRHESKKN